MIKSLKYTLLLITLIAIAYYFSKPKHRYNLKLKFISQGSTDYFDYSKIKLIYNDVNLGLETKYDDDTIGDGTIYLKDKILEAKYSLIIPSIFGKEFIYNINLKSDTTINVNIDSIASYYTTILDSFPDLNKNLDTINVVFCNTECFALIYYRISIIKKSLSKYQIIYQNLMTNDGVKIVPNYSTDSILLDLASLKSSYQKSKNNVELNQKTQTKLIGNNVYAIYCYDISHKYNNYFNINNVVYQLSGLDSIYYNSYFDWCEKYDLFKANKPVIKDSEFELFLKEQNKNK
jgi:hypothetical protein